MSRILIALTLVLALVVGVSVAGDYTKKTSAAWFDQTNCAMCKNMPMELYSSLTWEQHPIDKGIVSITTCTEAALPKYRKAHAAMMETAKKLQAGEKIPLCGSCEAFGACLNEGATYEYVETMNGDLMIVTAENPEVVNDLKAWAKRNKEEMAKMQQTHHG